jgi:MscS family membrane protein
LEGAGGVLLLLCLYFLIKRSIRKNRARFLDRQHKTAELLLSVLQAPTTLLLWVLGVSFVIDLLCRRLGFIIASEYVHSLRSAAIISIVAWLLLRWKRRYQDHLVSEGSKKIDLTTVAVVGRLTTVAVLILAALIIMQIFGMNVAPLIAFGSVGAASLGFAGKDVIANFCSGLILHVSRPFVIGDEIDLPEKSLLGTVEEIGWFRVTIRDADKRAVYLPNNYFSTTVVVNASRMTHRRMKQTIQIPFEAYEKMPDLIEALRKEISRQRFVDMHLPIDIHVRSFGAYALQLEVEIFFNEKNKQLFLQLQHEALLMIQSVALRQGVTIAVPTEQVIQRSF